MKGHRIALAWTGGRSDFPPSPGSRHTHVLDRCPLKTFENGAPGEIRTPDLLIRSQSLYPAELRALNSFAILN